MHKIKNFLRIIIAYFYLLYYRFPQKKLHIVGITGTDGKTTTANFLYQLLSRNGYKVGLISTINAQIGDKKIDTGFHVTSPAPQVVIKLLNQMVQSGIEYAVLEVTSHGLSQNRFAGIHFDYGVITNITSDHLDYHKTYKNYLYAKAKLILKSTLTFINKDDKLSFKQLKQIAFKNSKKVKPYSLEYLSAEYRKLLKKTLKTNYPGVYNQQNALAALVVFAYINGKEISKNDILDLKELKPLTGRFNKIDNQFGINIVIDFAHTPNALFRILSEINNLRNSNEKIISVFGCAGLRDASKRPVMGQIAGKLADMVIVTAEDPRTEKLNKINEQIVSGIKNVNGKYEVEENRQNAINKAISMAKPGDWVVITGKGHEKSMCFGATETPWSDFQAVEKALRRL